MSEFNADIKINHKQEATDIIIRTIFWSVVPSIGLIFLCVLSSILLNYFAIDSELLITIIGQSLPLFICFAVIPITILKLKDRVELKEIGISGNIQLLSGVLTTLLLIGVLLIVYLQIKQGNLNTLIPILIHLFFVALSEEVLTRGIIIRELRKIFSNNIALLLSALIFAFVFHSRENIVINLIIRVPLGLVFGKTYLVTKNIYASVAMHWLYNLLSILYS